jgi:hypothetical protein
MRRGVSIALLSLFSWILIAPLFASDSDAGLPACCRRNGKHHCAMRMAFDEQSQRIHISLVEEKCPYTPLAAVAVHGTVYQPACAKLFFAEIVRHPAMAPQTNALWRICFSRARQKRGPPQLSI